MTTSVPKKKEKQDEAIIGTNDYSIVSKRSVEKLYLHDEPEFLRPYIGKFKRRAPLINRGYWLRMRAIEHVVKTFLDEPVSKSKIIINLGCGYEPLPFRMLWKYKNQCRNVKFIDIDFPQLMHRKVQTIRKNTIFTDLLDGLGDSTVVPDSILLDDARYCAIGCDLGDAAQMRELFLTLQLQNHPVLFVAEVSVVYMEPDEATTLIKICGELPNARFCMLEQHLPAGKSHPFAKTMIDHFNKQTPLRALTSFPTIDSQRTRFKANAWPEVNIRNLWSLWQDNRFLDIAEKRALNTFEPFDEWEELALFAGHYFLLAATTHGASSFMPLGPLCSSKAELAIADADNHQARIYMLAIGNFKGHGLRRFGATFDVNNDSFAHHGGLVFSTRQCDSDVYSRSGAEVGMVHPPQSILCHTATTLHDGSVLLVGGRKSPTSPSPACHVYDNGKWTKTHDLKPARYRHCTVPVMIDNKAGVLVFGGRDKNGNALADWQLFDHELGWGTLDSDITIPLFGAAMAATSDTGGILLGGMTDSGALHSHYYEWQLIVREEGGTVVKCLTKPALISDSVNISRFGACLVRSQMGLVLIGGIGPDGVLKVDEEIILVNSEGVFLESTTLSRLLDEGRSRPMLTGHSAHVVDGEIFIVGGGGVCFSFGALWNEFSYVLRSSASEDMFSPWKLIPPDTKNASVVEVLKEVGNGNFKNGKGPAGTPKQDVHHAQAIPHANISSTEDFQQVVSTAQPVVLQQLDLGPCKTSWTSEYLKDRIGRDHSVIVHTSKEPHLSFLQKNFTYETQPFGAFIDAAMGGSYVYLRALSSKSPSKLPASLYRDFPTIADDFTLPDTLKMARENEHSSVLRISGQTTMWLHYDVMANILCQIRGSKRITLFPPADVSLLKFVHGETTSGLNVFTATEKDLKGTHPMTTILEEGEVLFIPACWAHATAPVGQGGSIAVNVFFRSFENDMYAAGRDVYGNRDLGVYQNGRRDIKRIMDSIAQEGEVAMIEKIEDAVRALRREGGDEIDSDKTIKAGNHTKEIVRILNSVAGLPDDIGKFYLNRLADELEDLSRGA